MKLFNTQFSKRHYQGFMIVLAAALILTGVFAYKTNTEKTQYQTFLQNTYQRSFRDLISEVENINTLLEKAQVTASSQHSSEIMTQAWKTAFTASENLNRLPISQTVLSNTAKYLTQVGDFCLAISRQNSANKLMDQSQAAQLSKLKDSSAYLLKQLQLMDQDVAMGKIKFGNLSSSGQSAFSRTSQMAAADIKFGTIGDKFNEYPTMIYDGPFSENVINGKPKGLPDKNVSLAEAEQTAKKFVSSDNISKITQTSSGAGTIPTYSLELTQKNNNKISVDVTKKGGLVLWLLNPRVIPEKKLTNQQASAIAKKFLSRQGFGSLEETFYLDNDNSTTITYADVSPGGVLIYPDQMKVKVALDDGEVVGFDSRQYIMAHHSRNIPKPKLAEEKARLKVSTKLDVNRVRLAIIPMPGDKEQLCYEFRGVFDNNEYFVYINADNGKEENILTIKKVPNGILAQ